MGLLDLLLPGGRMLRNPRSIRHNGKKLSEILEAHEKYHLGKPGGARADLSGAKLCRANLRASKLRDAKVHGPDFRGADLTTTILRGTDLTGGGLSTNDLSNTLRPVGWKRPES